MKLFLRYVKSASCMSLSYKKGSVTHQNHFDTSKITLITSRLIFSIGVMRLVTLVGCQISKKCIQCLQLNLSIWYFQKQIMRCIIVEVSLKSCEKQQKYTIIIASTKQIKQQYQCTRDLVVERGKSDTLRYWLS